MNEIKSKTKKQSNEKIQRGPLTLKNYQDLIRSQKNLKLLEEKSIFPQLQEKYKRRIDYLNQLKNGDEIKRRVNKVNLSLNYFANLKTSGSLHDILTGKATHYSKKYIPKENLMIKYNNKNYTVNEFAKVCLKNVKSTRKMRNSDQKYTINTLKNICYPKPKTFFDRKKLENAEKRKEKKIVRNLPNNLLKLIYLKKICKSLGNNCRDILKHLKEIDETYNQSITNKVLTKESLSKIKEMKNNQINSLFDSVIMNKKYTDKLPKDLLDKIQVNITEKTKVKKEKSETDSDEESDENPDSQDFTNKKSELNKSIDNIESDLKILTHWYNVLKNDQNYNKIANEIKDYLNDYNVNLKKINNIPDINRKHFLLKMNNRMISSAIKAYLFDKNTNILEILKKKKLIDKEFLKKRKFDEDDEIENEDDAKKQEKDGKYYREIITGIKNKLINTGKKSNKRFADTIENEILVKGDKYIKDVFNDFIIDNREFLLENKIVDQNFLDQHGFYADIEE